MSRYKQTHSLRTQAVNSGSVSYWFTWVVRALTRPFRREAESQCESGDGQPTFGATPHALQSMYLEELRNSSQNLATQPQDGPSVRLDGTRIDLKTLKDRVGEREVSAVHDAIMDQPAAAPPPNRQDISIRKKNPWGQN